MRPILFTFLIIISNSIFAQHNSCGLSYLEELSLLNRTNQTNFPINLRSDDTIFVPVIFHIVKDNEGNSSFKDTLKIFDKMCQLNKAYGKIGFQFYLYKDLNGILEDIQSDQVYNEPRSSLSVKILKENKRLNNHAINIYITNDISSNGQGGQILGYYSPNGDFIVMKDFTFNKEENILLAHEIGHYFSLAHTFFGWGNGAFRLEEGIPAPDSFRNNIVEYVDTNKMRNNLKVCELAADRICDTRADYSFRDWSNICKYSGNHLDPDGEPIAPTLETKNIMASLGRYCDEFVITKGQGKRMKQSYYSTTRDYLRKNSIPLKTTLGITKLIEPVHQAQLKYYDFVFLDWEDVNNAQFYLVELSRNRSFTKSHQQGITTLSEMTFNNLRQSNTYYWRVTPYNETQFCPRSQPTFQFKTGEQHTKVQQIDEIVDWSILQNNSSEIELNINSSQRIDLEICIIGVDGKPFLNKKIVILNGRNSFIFVPSTQSGIFLVQLKTKYGLESKKIVFAN